MDARRPPGVLSPAGYPLEFSMRSGPELRIGYRVNASGREAAGREGGRGGTVEAGYVVSCVWSPTHICCS